VQQAPGQRAWPRLPNITCRFRQFRRLHSSRRSSDPEPVEAWGSLFPSYRVLEPKTMQTVIARLQTARNRRVAVVLAAAGAVILATACGEKKKDNGAVQTAAKVNKEEITVQQINHALQQQRGLKPEQAEAASRQILERLIDQELALQKATELKLDREPRVMLQLEAARREVLSRAYLEKAGEAVSKPSAEEVAKYYEANPALFKDRRIYSLQELAIEAKPEQVAQLRTQLGQAKNIAEFVEYLKANDFRFSGNQAVRAAEQLPLPSLGTFAAMRDGQAILAATPNGAQVVVLAGSRSQPVTLQQATPAIEQFLLNERRREILVKDKKALRDAASIEYVGKFVGSGNASAPAVGASAAVSLPPPGSAASDGLGESSSFIKGVTSK
jgi:EpsD family peptidyl-prolyl cis-trans isomerase